MSITFNNVTITASDNAEARFQLNTTDIADIEPRSNKRPLSPRNNESNLSKKRRVTKSKPYLIVGQSLTGVYRNRDNNLFNYINKLYENIDDNNNHNNDNTKLSEIINDNNNNNNNNDNTKLSANINDNNINKLDENTEFNVTTNINISSDDENHIDNNLNIMLSSNNDFTNKYIQNNTSHLHVSINNCVKSIQNSFIYLLGQQKVELYVLPSILSQLSITNVRSTIYIVTIRNLEAINLIQLL